MPNPGDVVIVEFPGAILTKQRPAVVVSSDAYHAVRPDCVLALVTSNIASATTRFDHVLDDWREAGLDRRSAVRAYLRMSVPAQFRVIGELSVRDLRAVQQRLAAVRSTA